MRVRAIGGRGILSISESLQLETLKDLFFYSLVRDGFRNALAVLGLDQASVLFGIGSELGLGDKLSKVNSARKRL